MQRLWSVWQSLTAQERQQIRQLLTFLGIVVVFIIIASLTVGALTGGL